MSTDGKSVLLEITNLQIAGLRIGKVICLLPAVALILSALLVASRDYFDCIYGEKMLNLTDY